MKWNIVFFLLKTGNSYSGFCYLLMAYELWKSASLTLSQRFFVSKMLIIPSCTGVLTFAGSVTGLPEKEVYLVTKGYDAEPAKISSVEAVNETLMRACKVDHTREHRNFLPHCCKSSPV